MMYLVLFATVLAATHTMGSSNHCPEDWSFYEADQLCLKLFSDSKTNADARKSCQSFGGDLVVIKNEDQSDFVRSLGSTAYMNWIGVISETNNNHFKYVDGSKLGSYIPWKQSPNNQAGGKSCAFMYQDYAPAGKWRNWGCDVTLPYFCQLEIHCPIGWAYYAEEKQCVKSFTDPLSYDDARKKCQSEIENGNLAQIKTDAFTNFILDLNLPMINWIGLQDANADQTFHYLDGSGLGDYHPWSAGEPNNRRGKEHCGMVYGQAERAGEWNDAPCPDKHPFICAAQK